jgi:hypothetical protein
MATTSKLNRPIEVYPEQVSPKEVGAADLSALNSATQEIITPEEKTGIATQEAEEKRLLRDKRIEALSMTGTKAPKSKDSWLKTVGKYNEASPLNRIFDEGAKIREAERLEEC